MTSPTTLVPASDSLATGAARVNYAATRDLLTSSAEREVRQFWKSAAKLSPKALERATRRFMRDLVKQYGQLAADAAADYLTVEWSEWGDPYSSLGTPDVVGPTPGKYVDRSTNWAMQTAQGGAAAVSADETLERLVGMAARLVLSPANKTVAAAAQKAGVGFARVAEAGACAFCLILASRGGVYSDRSTAASSHDNCRCTAIQVRDDRELPKSSKRLMKEWAAWADDYDGQPTLEAWSAHRYQLTK